MVVVVVVGPFGMIKSSFFAFPEEEEEGGEGRNNA